MIDDQRRRTNPASIRVLLIAVFGDTCGFHFSDLFFIPDRIPVRVFGLPLGGAFFWIAELLGIEVDLFIFDRGKVMAEVFEDVMNDCGWDKAVESLFRATVRIAGEVR